MALNYQMIMKRYPKTNKLIGCLIPTHDSPSPFYLMENTTQRDGHMPPLPSPPPQEKKKKEKEDLFFVFRSFGWGGTMEGFVVSMFPWG